MKLREYFLCEKKTKITTWFNNIFSSVSVFDVRCTTTHASKLNKILKKLTFFTITILKIYLFLILVYSLKLLYFINTFNSIVLFFIF